jgi:threonine dehydratase
MEGLESLASIDVAAAARRLAGVVRRTPLVAFPSVPQIELRLKLECLQETGSFKARGAWNQVSQLDPSDRAAGVVATSSGNHGRALAWAARRAGVHATIVMPADAYPNKVQACRDEGAEVVLAPDRAAAEALCAERVAAGAVLVHPFDAERTIEGQGTVGLEIAAEWPEVELVLVPVGGGGLVAGIALALAAWADERGGRMPRVIGVEPEGAPTLSLALERGEPVVLERITTAVQGLCPLAAGRRNVALAERLLEGVVTLEDEEVFAAQRVLLGAGYVVEPAGAAAFAALHAGGLPEDLLAGHDAAHPLRVCCIVSGGNADPRQLASLA